jgi:histidinol-phosphate aminotransferase
MIRPDVRAQAGYRYAPPEHRVKLDQNESPYDLPEAIKREVLRELAATPFNRYPDIGAEPLRRALAEHHGWPEDGIVVAGGSNVLIQALVAACGIGQTVLCVSPTFAVYALQAKLLGARLVEVPLRRDFSLPLAELETILTHEQGVFFLANPAAPTGNLHPDEELQQLVERARPNWTLVIDEAYQPFAGTDFSSLAREHAHVASLRTFSKAFGLGGVRLGYLLAQATLAREIAKLPLPFSISSLQQVTGCAVLRHAEVAARYVGEVERERARVAKALAALPGVHVYPSHTNFLLMRVADAERTYRALLEHGVLVRRQDHLPGLDGCLRVTIGAPEENDAFLAAMQAALQAPAEVTRG